MKKKKKIPKAKRTSLLRNEQVGIPLQTEFLNGGEERNVWQIFQKSQESSQDERILNFLDVRTV